MNSRQRRRTRRQHLKGLTLHDSREIKRFSDFLEESAEASPGQLYAKHQEYLGLSDAEVEEARQQDLENAALALPNEHWVRGTRRPDWSICLDPANPFYGWKMYACNGHWVSGTRLTMAEAMRMANITDLLDHWPALDALIRHLARQDHLARRAIAEVQAAAGRTPA